MGILQDKKVAVALALIVIVVGSIAYFVMDVPRKDVVMDVPDEIASNTVSPDATSPNNIPLVENEAVI